MVAEPAGDEEGWDLWEWDLPPPGASGPGMRGRFFSMDIPLDWPGMGTAAEAASVVAAAGEAAGAPGVLPAVGAGESKRD